MADISIEAVVAAYDAEIGRLNGELIRLRLAFDAELAEFKKKLTPTTDVMEDTTKPGT